MCGLVRHLQEYGVEQTIVTNSNNRGTSVTTLNRTTKVFSLAERRIGALIILDGLMTLLPKIKSDVINIHGYGEYAGDVVCILKKLGLLNAPLVLTTHGVAGLKHGYLALDFTFPLLPKERIFRLVHLVYDFTFGRLEMDTFDRIIVLSDDEKKYLSKLGLNSNKIEYIPIAINEIFFTQPFSSTRNCILYVGRIDRFKGIGTLIEAIKEVLSRTGNVKCIIVGKDHGYKSKLESLINELGLHEYIEIKDHVSQQDLLNLYSSASVTVLPSLSEGFPLCLAESISLGTPFIGTPVGAVPELVKQSKAGLMVPIGDPMTLAKSICTVLDNPDLWSDMSNCGRKFAINFSWDRITKMYYDMYTDMILRSR